MAKVYVQWDMIYPEGMDYEYHVSNEEELEKIINERMNALKVAYKNGIIDCYSIRVDRFPPFDKERNKR